MALLGTNGQTKCLTIFLITITVLSFSTTLGNNNNNNDNDNNNNNNDNANKNEFERITRRLKQKHETTTGTNEKRQEEIYQRSVITRRSQPCLNLNINCGEWASLGECAKKASRNYMVDNCALACNRCNSLLDPLSSSSLHTDITGSSSSAAATTKTTQQAEDGYGYEVYHGVPQKRHFEEYTNLRREQQRMIRNDKTYDYRSDPTVNSHGINKYTSSVYLEKRIDNLLELQTYYLTKFYGTTMDQMKAGDDGDHYPVAETCLNRHPNCALWAARGFCERKPTSMFESCPLVCHFCQNRVNTQGLLDARASSANNHNGNNNNHNNKHNSKNTNHNNNGKKNNKNVPPNRNNQNNSNHKSNDHYKQIFDPTVHHNTPFHRTDLLGVFEALFERRVVVQPLSLSNFNSNSNSLAASSWASTTVERNGGRRIEVFTGNDLFIGGYTIERMLGGDLTRGKKAALNAIEAVYYDTPGRYKVLTSIANDTLHYPDYGTPGTPPKGGIHVKKWQQHIVVMDSFLTPDECASLLETIGYGIGVDTSVGLAEVNQDGFPLPTADLTLYGTKGKRVQHISRSSSRVYLYPSLTYDNDGGSSGSKSDNDRKGSSSSPFSKSEHQPRNRQLFAQAVERFIAKIGLVTGLSDVADYVEYPIRVDKYETKDFENAKGHFDKEALIGEEASRVADRIIDLDIERVLRDDDDDNFDDDDDNIHGSDEDLDEIFGNGGGSRFTGRNRPQRNIDLSGDLSDVVLQTVPPDTPLHPRIDMTGHARRPRVMKNARVLGLTVFLNDVARGGKLVFPNVGDSEGGVTAVQPVVGRAVLFPTVLNLKGKEHIGGRWDCIDSKFKKGFKGKDNTVLVEDLGTITAHEAVGVGEKYSVTVYLRRYPRRKDTKLRK